MGEEVNHKSDFIITGNQSSIIKESSSFSNIEINESKNTSQPRYLIKNMRIESKKEGKLNEMKDNCENYIFCEKCRHLSLNILKNEHVCKPEKRTLNDTIKLMFLETILSGEDVNSKQRIIKPLPTIQIIDRSKYSVNFKESWAIKEKVVVIKKSARLKAEILKLYDGGNIQGNKKHTGKTATPRLLTMGSWNETDLLRINEKFVGQSFSALAAKRKKEMSDNLKKSMENEDGFALESHDIQETSLELLSEDQTMLEILSEVENTQKSKLRKRKKVGGVKSVIKRKK